MRNPDIDKYADVDSPIHRFDPRAKLITFTFLIFSFVFIEDIRVALTCFGFSFVILLISKLPLNFIFKRMQPGMLFVFPFLLVMPFTVDGRVLYFIGPLQLTYEGLYYGFLVVIRAATAILLALTMLGSTKMDTLMKSLYALNIPSPFVQTLMFSYRYIFVFIDELLKIWTAMTAKGFKVGLNKHSMSVIGNIVGMILVRSYERADRVYHSMVSKGYTGQNHTIIRFKMKKADYVLSAGLFSFALLIQTYRMIL